MHLVFQAMYIKFTPPARLTSALTRPVHTNTNVWHENSVRFVHAICLFRPIHVKNYRWSKWKCKITLWQLGGTLRRAKIPWLPWYTKSSSAIYCLLSKSLIYVAEACLGTWPKVQILLDDQFSSKHQTLEHTEYLLGVNRP